MDVFPYSPEKFDDDKNGTLDINEWTKVMVEADSRLSSHPATAQVANQQGEYLAKELNAAAADTAGGRPLVLVHS